MSREARGAGFPRDSTNESELITEMELNPYFYCYTFSEVAVKAMRVTYQVSACLMFIVMYYHLKVVKTDPQLITAMCWGVAMGGHFIYQVVKSLSLSSTSKTDLSRIFSILFPLGEMKLSVFYCISTFGLAPLIRTLTLTVSSDSVSAMATFFLCSHLLTCDYGIDGFFKSRTVSMNSAVLAAICLTSRLPDEQHAIAMLTMAIVFFILFPAFSRILWDSIYCLTATVGITASATLVSTSFLVSYIFVIAFLTIVIPLLYIKTQHFKTNIYGPWDEAVVKNADGN